MRSIEKRNRLEAKEVTIVTRFTARPYKMGLSRLKIRVSAVHDSVNRGDTASGAVLGIGDGGYVLRCVRAVGMVEICLWE